MFLQLLFLQGLVIGMDIALAITDHGLVRVLWIAAAVSFSFAAGINFVLFKRNR